MIDTLFLLF